MMQRIGTKNLMNLFKATAKVPAFTGCRFMSGASNDANNLTIKSNMEQLSGIRLQELQAEAEGKVAFNDQPIIPDGDAGTFEKPILVPSQYDFRYVGYEDPACHQIRWFELQQGHPHYVPDIGLYFQLQFVPNTLPQNDMVDSIHHSIAH